MGMRLTVPAVVGRTDDKLPAAAYDLGDKVKAAMWAGVFVAIGVTVLIWVALALLLEVFAVGTSWEAWALAPGIGLVVGVVVACWFGFEWVYLAACRAWAVDDDERAYRRGLEMAAREEQEKAADQARKRILEDEDDDGNPATVSDVQRLHLVALLMLRRHYVDEKPATREAMTKAGLCTQPEWNAVNEAMKGLGIRKGYGFQPPDFPSAWAAWCESVRFAPDGYTEILTGRGWKAIGQWKAVANG